MTRLLPLLIALAPLAACNAAAPVATTEARALSALSIKTAADTIPFQVEVARTAEEQARGLMYRTGLAAGRGMIFPMDPPRPASFWMKNTFIPLDIIFIRPDGTIARIAENTVPESLDQVVSGEPVSAVLEIAGGEAARLGIAEGDRVRWQGE
jgi:uncharacterized membrane protein (UPF0127 family)